MSQESAYFRLTDTLAKIAGDFCLCPAAETSGERAEETVV
jgi:hypothetical protein